MSKQADKLFFWLIMVVIFLAITSLSYFTFLSKSPAPNIAPLDTNIQTKNQKVAQSKKKIKKPIVKKKQEEKKPSAVDNSSAKKKKEQTKNPTKSIPSTPPDTFPDVNEPIGGIERLLEGLFQRINSQAQMQYGQMLVDDFNLLDGGMLLEVKATTAWSLLHQGYKLQVLQVLANQYTLIACNVTRIVNCDPENIPSVSIIDAGGREIASHSSSRGPQIFE